MVDFTPGGKENSFIQGWNQCRKLPLCFWSATIKTSHNLNKNVVIKIRTYKVLNLPSTTTRSTHTGKSVHYKMGVLAVNWYAQYDHSPLVIRRKAQKNVISARDRKESSVYMDFWSRHEISSRCWRPGWNRPGMSKFSPRDHVHTKSLMTRHRGETHPAMKLVPGWVFSRKQRLISLVTIWLPIQISQSFQAAVSRTKA